MTSIDPPTRRQLVHGIAALPVAAVVPALPHAPIPAALAAIAADLTSCIALTRRCADALLRDCQRNGLAEPGLSYALNIVECTRTLPDAEDAANYLPERHDLYRHRLLWPLTGLCGFAELLPDRTPGLSDNSRLLCGTIHAAGMAIARELVPRFYKLQTGKDYPSFDT